MARQSVAYRLVSEGKDQLINDFRAIAEGGDASARKIGRAFERDLADAEKALVKLQDRAAKLEMAAPNADGATNRSNPVFTGSANYDVGTGGARHAASALFAEQDRLIQQRNVILAQINPLFAAQMQYNAAIERATDLRRREILSEEEFVTVQRAAKGALDEATSAHGGAVGASNAMRAGMQQAGFQVQDFVVQVAGGTSATRAFSQQAPQMIGSLQLMAAGAENGKGKFAQFANLISGPWGIALGIAIPVAGMLAEKLLFQGDAADTATDKLKKHKEAVDLLTESYNLMADAMNQAGGKAMQAQAAGELRVRTNERDVRKLTEDLAAAEARLTASQRVDSKGKGSAPLQRDVEDIKAQLRSAEQDLATSRNFVTEFEKRRLEAEKRLADEAKKKETPSSPKRDGADATPAQVSKLLLEAFGGNITSTVGGDHVKGSYHYRGQAVDFVPRGGMGALTKEQIRAVVEGAGLTVKELLGPGDKGHSDHFHVAWSGGRFDSMAKEAQEAAKLTKEYEQQSAELDNQLRIQMMRQQGMDREAEHEETRLALMRQFAGLDKGRLNYLVEQTNQVNDQKRAWEEIMAIIARLPTDLDIKPTSDADMQALLKIVNADVESRGGMVIKMMTDDAKDLARTINQDVGGALKGMMRGFNDLGDVALNILYSIGDSIIDNLLNQAGSGGGSSGGIGGFIAGAIGGLINGGAAIGTEYASGGAMWLAENGPELVNLPRGARVTPAAETRRLLAGANDNRPTISFAPVINAPGADAAALARVEAKLEQMRRDMPTAIKATMIDMDQRTHGRWQGR